jgi:competence protein ComEC
VPEQADKPQLFHWSEQPVFHAVLAYACGIVAARSLAASQREWVALALALVIAAALLLARRSPVAILLALGAFIPCGAFVATLETRAQPVAPDLSAYTQETMEITAHVTATTLPRFDAKERELRTVDLESESISNGTNVNPLVIGIRATLRENGKLVPELHYGDRLRFIARLREPRNYGNTGAMDYRGFLLDKGIVALASVPATSIEVLPGQAGSRFGFVRARLRDSVLSHILSLAQEPCGSSTCMSREDVGVLAAMTIGEQSLLDRPTKVDFQRTGAFHILVVSGMNVGIVAFAVFWVCRRLRASEVTATWATIVLALLYSYMTDMGAPILRAALMLAIFLVARLIYREKYSLNAIGITALILLVASPSSLFDASFQLTFLSVAALGGIVHPLLERTIEPYRLAMNRIDLAGYDAALAPKLAQLRLDLRMIAGRVGLFVPAAVRRFVARGLAFAFRAGCALCELLILTVTLQVALALPMVWYFHRLAVVGVPVNIVIVPLTSLLMPISILATLATYVSAGTAKVFGVATSLVLHAITGTVSWLAAAPGADIRFPTPLLWAAVFSGAVFVFALSSFKASVRRAWVAAAMLGIAAVLLTIPREPEIRADAAEITAIDVSQGDSLLLISPEGKTLLVDGGGPPGYAQTNSFDVGEDVISPYLWSRGFSHLDAVMLTHPHSDHMSGLRAVITNFHPAELWLSEDAEPRAPALVESARNAGTRVRHLRVGDEVRLGSFLFNVLSAGSANPETTVNDDSVVLRATYRDESGLLLGDAERALESEIARKAGKIDVLKVAHHGSATSTTPELLAATRPKFAVISVGAQNSYGHPRAEVLERLKAANAQIYRTDRDGATTFYLNGSNVTVESYYARD